MTMADPGTRSYSAPARFFHWLTFVLVALMIPTGIAMTNVGAGATQNVLFDFHRSLGITVALLTIVRLVYRLSNPPPPHEASIAPIQALAANVVHWVLYAALIMLPIGGAIGAFMFGASLNYFWLFTIDPPIAKNPEMARQILGMHGLSSFVFTGLIGLHIVAALAHHIVFKDRTLLKMLRG
jgi:cytochrome b561